MFSLTVYFHNCDYWQFPLKDKTLEIIFLVVGKLPLRRRLFHFLLLEEFLKTSFIKRRMVNFNYR